MSADIFNHFKKFIIQIHSFSFQKKASIKEAYLKEIVDVEEFSKEYKAIDEKLELLEQKRIETIDLNKQSFSPQYLMADRDVEKKANPF